MVEYYLHHLRFHLVGVLRSEISEDTMNITPTDKGSLMAGIGISSLAWLSMFKMDYLAKKVHVNRWVSQDRTFGWVNKNKSLTLLCTEVINFAVHGISNPASVLFALGSTIINALFIFVVIPVKMSKKLWGAQI